MLKAVCLAVVLAAAVFGQSWTVTIASGQAVSSVVAIGPEFTQERNLALVGLATPSVWTAADLIVETTLDGSTWLPVYDADGVLVRIKVDANRMIVLDASVFWPLRRIRFRSVAVGGTADVNQTAARTFTLMMR